MIKQFVRLALAATLWRRYKTSIISVVALLLFWFLVGFFHGEYVNFAEATDQREKLALSFFIKWGLGLTGLLIFVLFHLGILAKVLGKLPTQNGPPPADVAASAVSSSQDKPRSSFNSSSEASSNLGKADEDASDDPFARLRDKPKLRSRADIALDQQKPRS